MSKPTSPPRRRGRLLRIGAACTVLLALAGYLIVQLRSTTGPSAPRCTVRAGGKHGTTYELRPEQAANAATIGAVGSSRRLPERAVTIALATAMQESDLRNISYGDRDSLGLFQQRPSQGWGGAKQIMNPAYAAGRFYEHLVEVPGYSELPLTVAAQKVQRSGYPQAYAKHEPNASLLSSALTGRAPATLSCTTGSGDRTPGDPAQVRARLQRDFGPKVLPRIEAPGRGQGVSGSSGSENSGSRSIVEVPVAMSAGRGDADRRGWEVAHWAVAHASELRIAQVSYAGRVWRAGNSEQGWGAADENSGAKGSEDPGRGTGTVLITTAQ